MAISDALKGTQNQGHTSTAGGAVGKVMDALTGRDRTHRVDLDREDSYWRENYKTQPYFRQGQSYDDYAHAYHTGYTGFSKYEPGTRFEDAEATLQEDYVSTKATMPWSEARHAALAAWNRIEGGGAFTVPLSEEELNVSKREVESGGVRLRKVVRTETVNQPVQLKREEAVIERVTPTSQQVPADAFKEGTIEVPLKREEAVVQKTAHVTGEVQVRKDQKVETQNVQGQVRKEDVVLEKEGQAEIRRESDLKK